MKQKKRDASRITLSFCPVSFLRGICCVSSILRLCDILRGCFCRSILQLHRDNECVLVVAGNGIVQIRRNRHGGEVSVRFAGTV